MRFFDTQLWLWWGRHFTESTYMTVLSFNFRKNGKFCRLGCPDLYTPGATIAKFSGGTRGIFGCVRNGWSWLDALLSFTMVVSKKVYRAESGHSQREFQNSRLPICSQKIKTPQSHTVAFNLLPRTITMTSSGPSAASQKKRKLSGESLLNH